MGLYHLILLCIAGSLCFAGCYGEGIEEPLAADETANTDDSDPCAPEQAETDSSVECVSDSDCEDLYGPNHLCNTVDGLGSCYFVGECFEDSDCESDAYDNPVCIDNYCVESPQ